MLGLVTLLRQRKEDCVKLSARHAVLLLGSPPGTCHLGMFTKNLYAAYATGEDRCHGLLDRPLRA